MQPKLCRTISLRLTECPKFVNLATEYTFHYNVTHAMLLGMQKEYCCRGHKYTPENTSIDSKGRKVCKDCRKIYDRENYLRHRAERMAYQSEYYRAHRAPETRNIVWHGDSNTRLYRIFCSMWQRCIHSEGCYRGIQVCAQWDSYLRFKEWALTHGYQGDLTIDRIDPKGHYTPSNCRFITYDENRNRAESGRKPHAIQSSNGIIYPSIAEAARQLGCAFYAIYRAVDQPERTSMGLSWRRIEIS